MDVSEVKVTLQITKRAEKRVRLDFNPSNSGSVHNIKLLTAALISNIEVLPAEDPETARLKALAMTAAEEAAMWAVKAATS